MEKFSVSVNIPPQSHVTFTLTYEELLQRHLGSYEIMIGVRPKQLVQNFEVHHQFLSQTLFTKHIQWKYLNTVNYVISVLSSLQQIVVDIYEPNGIAFVDVNGTFITNELLPLVKKTVADKKVRMKTLKQSPNIGGLIWKAVYIVVK